MMKQKKKKEGNGTMIYHNQKNMKDSGEMIKNMEKEYSLLNREIKFIMECGKRIKRMEVES